MKYLLFSFLILLIFSCDIINEQSTKATFTIENEYNEGVKLVFFTSSTMTENRSINLNLNEAYTGDIIESSVGGIFDNPELSTLGGFFGDSIVVIYNNERFMSHYLITAPENTFQYSEPINRNLFRSGNYEEVSEENFIYTITQEDFDSATPCDGPCE